MHFSRLTYYLTSTFILKKVIFYSALHYYWTSYSTNSESTSQCLVISLGLIRSMTSALSLIMTSQDWYSLMSHWAPVTGCHGKIGEAQKRKEKQSLYNKIQSGLKNRKRFNLLKLQW